MMRVSRVSVLYVRAACSPKGASTKSCEADDRTHDRTMDSRGACATIFLDEKRAKHKVKRVRKTSFAPRFAPAVTISSFKRGVTQRRRFKSLLAQHHAAVIVAKVARGVVQRRRFAMREPQP
jgi:hypothetical protein